VIVIDPDPLIRAVVEVVLERHNYNVIQCETTSQAMEVGQSVGQIAIVLADGAMMEAGDQTLRLSLLKIDSKVRFILLCDTGCNLESENPAQADAFLEKPFNVPRLLETVARVLGT
jgi:DNA-binding NtrC family response regulator